MTVSDPLPRATPRCAPPPPPVPKVLSARLRGAPARARRALGLRVPPEARPPRAAAHGKPLPPPPPRALDSAREAGVRVRRVALQGARAC